MADTCPTCGADVRVVGEGVTKHYEPTLAARVEELEGALEAILAVPNEVDFHVEEGEAMQTIARRALQEDDDADRR